MERKIIHIDMDCFYAAIEVRDNPSLRSEPVAVGGRSSRGVLTTCNYKARRFGVHSAMPNFMALKRCPHLVILPVRFEAYRQESRHIRKIMARYTDLIEPLSLDEAFLDVSSHKEAAREIAIEIKRQIRRERGLVASVGVAPNKMLAKIASDWRKPDGLFQIRASNIDDFLSDLPVSKIWGIGKKSAEKLQTKGVRTCGDLQAYSPLQLTHFFGKFGAELHNLCRGIDNRPVIANRIRKSISVERTFPENLETLDACLSKIQTLFVELEEEIIRLKSDKHIAKLFVKLKFSDFTRTTIERTGLAISKKSAESLCQEAFGRKALAVRLIGIGVRFASETRASSQQMQFDFAGNRSKSPENLNANNAVQHLP